MPKSVGKFRKNCLYDDDFEYSTRKFSSRREKSDISEVKRNKNVTYSRLKNMDYRDVLDKYGSEEEWA